MESSSHPGPASPGGTSRMPPVNGVGKPCAGEPHARIDGRELETEQPGHGHDEERPRGKPRRSSWRRVLPPKTATAPAPDPPSEIHTHLKGAVDVAGQGFSESSATSGAALGAGSSRRHSTLRWCRALTCSGASLTST